MCKAHAIGTAIVYATQRGDHKHPIRSIANALKHLEKDEESKKVWRTLSKDFKRQV